MPVAPPYAWLNGAVVPWVECVLHARSQGAMWGANVFEGIRAYWLEGDRQLSMFRVSDHLARLRRSMKCTHMRVEYSDAEIERACADLLLANEFAEDVHLVVVAYFESDTVWRTEGAGMHMTAVPVPRSDAYCRGASACISSWRRIGDDTMPPRVKVGANYHNSRLAQEEATRNGYDTALLLNQRGTLAEAPGSCLVGVWDGRLVTPSGTSGVLEGITLATVEELAAQELGIGLERREIDRTELYTADEAFICGTLVEIEPIVSIDRVEIGAGEPGELTRTLQRLYERAVRAERPYRRWATGVGERVEA
jgi:branched-chain amino acid aminotransferase